MRSREYDKTKIGGFQKFYKDIIKRFFDVLLSVFILIITSPLLLIGYIYIKTDTSGPALFTQERIGKHGEKFKIYKLRTMIMESHYSDGTKIRDRDRVTKSGKLIRKLSIDELPQLFNIIKGDMSFIGPRPLLIRYLPYYTNEEMRRHDVLPGITGLAQVNGRSYLRWEERFAYDVEYVDNISFLNDIKIILKTIKIVITGEGTSAVRPPDLVDFDVHRQNK